MIHVRKLCGPRSCVKNVNACAFIGEQVEHWMVSETYPLTVQQHSEITI